MGLTGQGGRHFPMVVLCFKQLENKGAYQRRQILPPGLGMGTTLLTQERYTLGLLYGTAKPKPLTMHKEAHPLCVLP